MNRIGVADGGEENADGTHVAEEREPANPDVVRVERQAVRDGERVRDERAPASATIVARLSRYRPMPPKVIGLARERQWHDPEGRDPQVAMRA